MNIDFDRLNHRRRELRMSNDALARLSRVSLPTVVRILSGKHPQTSFANVAAIAGALGLDISFRPTASSSALREEQATKKARKLVGMVQATSGLEAQAVDAQQLQSMTQQTVHELLTGSSRRLWGE